MRKILYKEETLFTEFGKVRHGHGSCVNLYIRKIDA